MELRSITVETLAAFAQALRAEERCTETIKQYTRSVRQFAAWLAPETVAAGSAGGWKAELLRRGLSPATVNSKLAGLNRFFRFLGWMDCTVKPLRLQRRLFRSPDRELSRAEYGRLLSAARAAGARTVGGMPMLVWQAAVAHTCWYGADFQAEAVASIIADANVYMNQHFRQ